VTTAWDRRRAGFRRFIDSGAARLQLTTARRTHHELGELAGPVDVLRHLEDSRGEERGVVLSCVIRGAGSGSGWRDLAIALLWLHLDSVLHRRFVRRAMQFRGALDDAEDSYCTALTFVAAEWPRDRLATVEALTNDIDACVAVEACGFERWRKRHRSDAGGPSEPPPAAEADVPSNNAVLIAWEHIVRDGAGDLEHTVDARRALLALEMVAPGDVDAIVAHTVADESLRAIARRTGVSHTIVRRRIALALIQVRQVLRGGRDDA